MRQIVKKVNGGEDIILECSRCGNFIYNIFVPSGKKRELDCDKIPEKCSCGERLTNRQPIIDEDLQEINDTHIRVYKNKGDNAKRDVHKNKDIYRGYIRDLESAISIDYFGMRLDGLKKRDLKIPDNIDNMMMECIKRNISHTESNIKQLSHKDATNGNRELQEQLNILTQKRSELTKKLDDKREDKKDVSRKNNKVSSND